MSTSTPVPVHDLYSLKVKLALNLILLRLTQVQAGERNQQPQQRVNLASRLPVRRCALGFTCCLQKVLTSTGTKLCSISYFVNTLKGSTLSPDPWGKEGPMDNPACRTLDVQYLLSASDDALLRWQLDALARWKQHLRSAKLEMEKAVEQAVTADVIRLFREALERADVAEAVRLLRDNKQHLLSACPCTSPNCRSKRSGKSAVVYEETSDGGNTKRQITRPK